MGSVLLIFLVFLCCPIMCLYVLGSHDDFRIKTMFGSVRLYLQLFVGGLVSYLLYLCLLVCSGVQHILCCVFVFPRLLYTMLPVSLDCPFVIVTSVFSFIYLISRDD